MILLLNIYKFKLSNIRLISVYFLRVSVFMVFSLLFVQVVIFLLCVIFGLYSTQESYGVMISKIILIGRKQRNYCNQLIWISVILLTNFRFSTFGVVSVINMDEFRLVLMIIIYIKQSLIRRADGSFGNDLNNGGRFLMIGKIVFSVRAVLEGVNGVSRMSIMIIV